MIGLVVLVVVKLGVLGALTGYLMYFCCLWLFGCCWLVYYVFVGCAVGLVYWFLVIVV